MQLIKLLSKLIQEQSYIEHFFGGTDSLEQAFLIRDDEPSPYLSLSDVVLNDKLVELFDVTSTLGLKWSLKLDSFFVYRLRTCGQIEEITSKRPSHDLVWLIQTLIHIQ